MKQSEIYDASCASWWSLLCVHDCMHMHVQLILAAESCAPGFPAVCKSQHLGGRQNHRLSPLLFCAILIHGELFTAHTQTHMETVSHEET